MGRFSVSYRGAILTLGASTTAAGAFIRSPRGSRPSPLSLMLLDFDRADEDAWLIGASYDFGRLGFEGLSAFINYAHGQNGRNATTGGSLNDRSELDLTVCTPSAELGDSGGLS